MIDHRNHQVGEIIEVKAWWFPDKRVVKCKITERCAGNGKMGDFYMVQPLDHPGAHGRYIRTARDL